MKKSILNLEITITICMLTTLEKTKKKITTSLATHLPRHVYHKVQHNCSSKFDKMFNNMKQNNLKKMANLDSKPQFIIPNTNNNLVFKLQLPSYVNTILGLIHKFGIPIEHYNQRLRMLYITATRR